MNILEVLPADVQAEMAVDSATQAAEGENSEVTRLAGLGPLAYERQRRAAAEKLGCRVSTLDAMVRALRCGPEECSGDGAAVSFEAPEPWPASVDGAALLQEMVATFERFLALPPRTADALALWVVHAHCHEAADVSPILALTSPEKRCGKTRTLTLLGRLVPKPLPTANITVAAVFRSVEKWRPTLLIDEGDSFLRDNEDLCSTPGTPRRRRTSSALRERIISLAGSERGLRRRSP
jgi:putative DNA primase/helicase